MKIQWVSDTEDNMYWDMMKERKPKSYPKFDMHVVCEIEGECTCKVNSKKELDCE